MNTLNLSQKKVSNSTANEIINFVYENRLQLGNDLKLFYADVRGLIEIQLRKNKAQRMTMSQILERAYNIEAYVMASGAASYDVEFVKL